MISGIEKLLYFEETENENGTCLYWSNILNFILFCFLERIKF